MPTTTAPQLDLSVEFLVGKLASSSNSDDEVLR